MTSKSDMLPPKWPLRLMKLFVKNEYLEEIEGDMEEIFRDNLQVFGPRGARRRYAREVLTLLRPILISRISVPDFLPRPAMFANYLKASSRGLLKSPLSSTINVFGLAVATGLCVFGYSFARWTYSTDQFHQNKNTVFLITQFADHEGSIQQYGTTPRPLADMLKKDFAQIKGITRVEDADVVVKSGDNVFHETVRFVDPDFLGMFTFPLKSGLPGSLGDVNSVILSDRMAMKYFGESNPIGSDLQIRFDEQNAKTFKVTGVAQEFPKARTIDFDFLVNFENVRAASPSYDNHDWTSQVRATFIQVARPSDLATLRNAMGPYLSAQNAALKNEHHVSSFSFEPLATLHERSSGIRDAISRSSDENYASVIYISAICAFMLLLASFNYINIAIVSAARRLREIGLRKSIGATRLTLIVQFLTENLVVTAIALGLGIVLGYSFFIPGFESLWSFSMDFRLLDPTLWLFLAVVLLVTSVVSGIYPALYISRFQVVGILKGTVRFGRKNPVTKTLMIVQLAVACMFITCAVMFSRNSGYITQRSWGYSPSETLYVRLPKPADYNKLHDLMSQVPGVINLAGSEHHLGKSRTTATIQLPGNDLEVNRLSVGPSYFETMGLRLKTGRYFNEHDVEDAIIVNETLLKATGWDDAIGRRVKINNRTYTVIGVTEDFHTYSFNHPLKPTVLTLAPKTAFRYLLLNVKPPSQSNVFKAVQNAWSSLFPEIPFDGGFQDQVWGSYFEEIEIHGIVWRVIAFLAISVAGLGLYGLMAIHVAGRRREFSLRKVLGANVRDIAKLISSQYIRLFVIALVIGAPLSQALITYIFDSAYAYHIPIDWLGVTVAEAIVCSVGLLTASLQIRSVVNANPVNGLRVE